MLQSRNDVELFTATWFVAHFALAYLPLDFQIHLLLGWQIPLAILAASALTTRVGPAIANRLHISRRIVIGSLVALCLVTNLYILVWRFVDLRRYDVPYFLSTDEVAALDWLAEHATSQDVVLARLDFGQYVPMWSDARAILAHWTGTVNFHEKMESVDAFFSIDTPAPERMAVLTDSAISYIVAQGEDIQTLTDPRFTAETAGALDLVPMFTQGQVAVYGIQTW
jgi:hypothetical protein